VLEYLESAVPSEPFAVLRHDVDKRPDMALRMARLEAEKGISSTYYFRRAEHCFDPAIIGQVAALGHEIGYHYEVLARTRGDVAAAISLFQSELEDFRAIAPIRTITMHGSSLSPHDNRDIWKQHDFKDYGLVGEGYLSIDFSRLAYVSDTGGTWDNLAFNIKDQGELEVRPRMRDSDQLIEFISNGKLPALYLLAHPDRWTVGSGEWVSEFVTKRARNLGKRVLKKGRKPQPKEGA